MNLTSFKCKKAEGYYPRGKFSPCFSGSELATFLNLTREAVIILSAYFNYQLLLSISTRDIWVSEELRIQMLPLDELDLKSHRKCQRNSAHFCVKYQGPLHKHDTNPEVFWQLGSKPQGRVWCTGRGTSIALPVHSPLWKSLKALHHSEKAQREEISLKANVSLVYLGFHAHL